MSAKKIVILSMFVCISMGIYALESIIPPLLFIPGAKLGLANVVTLVAIYVLGRKEAFVIMMLRIVLTSLLFGNMMAFWFSVSGGILSFAVMAILSLFMDNCNIWAISVFGALAHNFGQVAVAVLLTEQLAVMYYFLFLVITAIITGVFTGICAKLCIDKAVRLKMF